MNNPLKWLGAARQFSLIGACLVCFAALIWPLTVFANSYNQAPLNDEQFLLLDVKSKNLRFLEAVDAYTIDEQILLPVAPLLQALEMNFVVSVTEGTIKLTRNNTTVEIDLVNQTDSGPLADIEPTLHWSNESDELLVSHLLIEALIDAPMTFSMSALAIDINNTKAPFPVVQRLAREERRRKAIRVQPGGIPDDASKIIFADEFILDTYQLFSPPHANINLNSISSGGNTTDTKLTSFVQSNFDLLYHYTELTLNKQTGSDVATNLSFNRHQASPYESFALGIKNYSFGDIFGKSDNLTLGNQGGIGLSVSRRPVNYSRKFGAVTIEDMATPGWEIELYRGGILLETSTVPADGRYVFEDVETLFGVNRFEIKLYGPYGEEEVQHKNIRITSTQLKSGEYGFSSYVLDAGNKLLEGINGESRAFNPDTFGFAYDYGLNDKLTLGFNLTQKEDNQNKTQQFVGTELQTSIPGALISLNASHQLGEGYAGLFSVVGRLWDSTTYQFNYEKDNNFQTEDTNLDRDLISASMSGRLFKTGYTNAVTFNGSDQSDILNVINRVSGRVGKLNLTNNLTYQETQFKGGNDSNDTETFTGDFSVAGRLSSDLRLSGSLRYDLKDNAEIDQFRLNTGYRITDKMNFNSQLEYTPDSTNKWRINNSLAWSAKNATFHSSVSYDANDQWSVSLGLTFSLGYDHHNNNWMMNAKNMASLGTLDINSYLDQNNNQQLDEGDVALPGVKFGHSKLWEGIVSNEEGKVVLPFISTFSPTPVSPSWVEGVSPSTRSYSIYTHPGSRISAQIPFTVKTTISGFILLNDENGEPLANTNVLLKDHSGNTSGRTLSDEDGYYEFIDIEPGRYQIFIDPAALTSRTLKSDPGSLQFTTPAAGGYFELGVIAAIPGSQSASNATRVVKPTIDNYEPLEEIEQLLGFSVFAREDDQATIAGPSLESAESDITTVAPLTSFTEQTSTVTDTATNIPKVAIATQMLKSASVLPPAPVNTGKANNKAKPQLKRSSVQRPDSKASTVSQASNSPRFALQFGIYSTASLTNDLIKTLRAKGVSAQSYFDKKLMGYRVLMGPFNSKAQARAKSTELKSQGLDSFTRDWPTQLQSTTTPTTTSATATSSNLPSNPLQKSGFSIQMMVAQSQKSIDDIVNNNRLGDDLYQIKKAQQGLQVNVLLKGHYLTRAQAQQAVSDLPAQWHNKTWIRPVSQLRTEQIN